eukprot:559645-Prymnesium_polylepis.1
MVLHALAPRALQARPGPNMGLNCFGGRYGPSVYRSCQERVVNVSAGVLAFVNPRRPTDHR